MAARVQALAFDALTTWRSVLPGSGPRIVLSAGLDELAHADFPCGLAQRLAAADLPWAAVELDLRRGVLRAADAAVIAMLCGLRRRGVTLALDDAAHPEAVAPMLTRLDLDRLKRDTAVGRDLPREAGRQALADRLMRLARGHRLAVSAEGVETAEEVE